MQHPCTLFHPDSVGGAGLPPLSPRPPATLRGELPPEPQLPKIKAFDQKVTQGPAKGDDGKSRLPNVTGAGAVRTKSFHCKLTGESLEFLDKQINDWLDAHPQYEVKFVTSTVGDWSGKLKEPNLIVQLWL